MKQSKLGYAHGTVVNTYIVYELKNRRIDNPDCSDIWSFITHFIYYITLHPTIAGYILVYSAPNTSIYTLFK